MKRHGIDLDSEAVRDFCRKWKIRELSVFGSILRDDFGPDSDIDFLIEHEEDADWNLFDDMEMQEELEQIVGRKVDIVDRAGVESSHNRLLKREIISTAEHIYAA